jgi:hypothetical protein
VKQRTIPEMRRAYDSGGQKYTYTAAETANGDEFGYARVEAQDRNLLHPLGGGAIY